MDTQNQAQFYYLLTNVHFAEKEIKVKDEKEHLNKCITKTAEASIKLIAERKCDDCFLCKIRGEDLCA